MAAKVRKGVPPGTKIPMPNGGYLISNAGGGKQPRAGRPRDEWKAALREMVSNDQVLEHVRFVLQQGPDHPFFERALQYATDHGMGKAVTPVEHSGSLGLIDLLSQSHSPAE